MLAALYMANTNKLDTNEEHFFLRLSAFGSEAHRKSLFLLSVINRVFLCTCVCIIVQSAFASILIFIVKIEELYSRSIDNYILLVLSVKWFIDGSNLKCVCCGSANAFNCLRVNVYSCGFSFTFESCMIELIELSDLPCDGQIFQIILSLHIFSASLCLPAANTIYIDSKFSLELELDFVRPYRSNW